MHRLTEFSLKRPWLTLAILLAITVGLGLGVPKVKPAFGFRVLLGENHSAVQALDSLIEQFSGGYPVRIAWECGQGHPCNTVFDPVSLKMADSLTNDLFGSPVIADVVGPANASLLIGADHGFEVRRLIENGSIAADREILSQEAAEDSLWVGSLISSDSKLGVVVLQPANSRPETDLVLATSLNKILIPYREQGFTFHILGDAPANVSAGKALAESTDALIPILALVIASILYLLTRCWNQTLATMATMGLGLLWTLGILGWLQWPKDGMLEVLAPLIVIVCVCDAVHFLSRYAEEQTAQSKPSQLNALLGAAKGTGPACVVTTLTSAVAFASFTASDLDTFVRFGVILPAGIVICLILSFSFLPIMMSLLPFSSKNSNPSKAIWHPVISAMVDTSYRRSAPMLTAALLLLAFFGYGWAVHLRADNDWLESLGESSEVVRSIDFVENILGGSSSLEVDIKLPPSVTLEDPTTLATLAHFSESLSRIEMLGKAESALDLIKRLNRLLHNGDPEFNRVGDSTAANAELMELIAFDDPDNLSRWVSVDRSRIRLSLGAVVSSQSERLEILADVDRLVETLVPQSWDVDLTGELAIQHAWVRDVQATQLRSFPIAFGIVFILVSVFLRSWKLGLAAMVPTLLPVVVVLGAMGWIGMSLDVARAMLAAVVIGIGVDDAIHLLAHYKARREEGDDPHAAIAAALQHTGRAIVTTSVALALGFLTLMMSAWQTVASFGFFVAIAIMGALVATLFVLPALIFAFTKGQKADAT